MSRVFYIGDLHFGHRNILKFSGLERGNYTLNSVEEHDEWIIQQWNKQVTKRDIVWVLGDVLFNSDRFPLLDRLNGTKHLVLGNHDDFKLEQYIEKFGRVAALVRRKGVWLSHAPIHPVDLRGKPNIHGHVHRYTVDDPWYYNVSVENCEDGMPVPQDKIFEEFKKRGVM